MLPSRDLIQKLLLLLGSLGFTLVAAELVARATRGAQKGGKEQGERILYAEYDPVLGWHKKAGARVTYDRRDYKVEVSINAHGLRDRERDYPLPSGTFRILALGDSFVEAFMVPYDRSVTQRLEADLTGSGCPMDVVNGGTSGYSTDQEYLFYREEGSRYSPGIVILFFYYNDVLYNNMDENIHIPKPLLSFEGGEPRVVNFPVPRQTPVQATRVPSRRGLHGSAALDWVAGRLEASSPRTYQLISRTGLFPPIHRLRVLPEFRVYRAHLPDEIKEAWTMTARILSALDSEVRAKGGRFLVAYVPSRMEVSDTDWELTQIQYGLKDGRWDRGRVLKGLGQICTAGKIPLLDLTPPLKRAGAAFFENDSHWNARGQAAAATEIAGFLKREGWVRCP